MSDCSMITHTCFYEGCDVDKCRGAQRGGESWSEDDGGRSD